MDPEKKKVGNEKFETFPVHSPFCFGIFETP